MNKYKYITFQNYKPKVASCPIAWTNINSEVNEQLTIVSQY